METTYPQGSIIHLPDAIIDLLQADIFTGTNRGNLNPVGAPAHTAAGIDETDLEMIGVFEGQDLARHRAGESV